jgi:hypothetical protein
LDFDEVACAHILLQMNYIQNLFEFQIVDPPDFIHSVSISTKGDDYVIQWFDDSILSFSTKKEDYIVQWFDKIVLSKLENDSATDYWIGITFKYTYFIYLSPDKS